MASAGREKYGSEESGVKHLYPNWEAGPCLSAVAESSRRGGLFAIRLQSILLVYVAFHTFRCHPMLCKRLNLRSRADSIPVSHPNLSTA